MRKTKLITAQFADGERTLPSSVKITCTVTGQSKGFYTPYLIKLIERKYDNSYSKFISTYVSKGNKKKVDQLLEEDPYKLYRQVLQYEYTFLLTQPRTSKTDHRLSVIKDRFTSRFPDEEIENNI